MLSAEFWWGIDQHLVKMTNLQEPASKGNWNLVAALIETVFNIYGSITVQCDVGDPFEAWIWLNLSIQHRFIQSPTQLTAHLITSVSGTNYVPSPTSLIGMGSELPPGQV